MSKRLLKELQKIKTLIRDDPGVGVGAMPRDGNLTEWQAVIVGPPGTPYEGGWFQLSMSFPAEYPHKPPRVKFDHAVFHPNVYENNHICLDILDENWTPLYQVDTVLTSIRSLLNDPNINSPANVDASIAFKKYKPNDPNNAYCKQVLQTMQQTNRYQTPLPEWYNELYMEALESAQEAQK